MTMKRTFKLDERLALCAEFVRENSRLADIGTDHAYLPVWLAINGKIKSAVASDIRPMPLERGAENIKKYHCENLIETRLSSGLDEYSEKEIDDIVIAGMGGELIVDILKKAPWVCSKNIHLILQPMTRANILREYLFKNGFSIVDEKACRHGGKVYSVMSVFYTGEKVEQSLSKVYIGKLDFSQPDTVEYVEEVLKKLRYKLKGLLASGSDTREMELIIAEIEARCKYEQDF